MYFRESAILFDCRGNVKRPVAKRDLKEHENMLLVCIPDPVWNFLLDGKVLSAMNVLRNLGIPFKEAHAITIECRIVLGIDVPSFMDD